MANRFEISNFKTEINQNGVLQNNRFLAVIAMPEGLRTPLSQMSAAIQSSIGNYYYQDNPDFITIRCETVTIPGQNFFTQELKRYGYGQIERNPYLPTFNPMKMVFVADRNAKILQFFNEWANLVVNHDVEHTPGENHYLLNYKSQYISPVVRVFVYNEYDELVFVSKTFECYPLTISEYDVSWASQNDFIRLSVSMQFVHAVKEFSTKSTKSYVNQSVATVQPAETPQPPRTQQVTSLNIRGWTPNPLVNSPLDPNRYNPNVNNNRWSAKNIGNLNDLNPNQAVFPLEPKNN